MAQYISNNKSKCGTAMFSKMSKLQEMRAMMALLDRLMEEREAIFKAFLNCADDENREHNKEKWLRKDNEINETRNMIDDLFYSGN